MHLLDLIPTPSSFNLGIGRDFVVSIKGEKMRPLLRTKAFDSQRAYSLEQLRRV